MPVARIGVIGGVEQPVIDARELHTFLAVGKKFLEWFDDRVETFNFVKNQDFANSAQERAKIGRGRPSTEYDISTGMAKELCMVAPQEKGSAARKYFAAVEERAREMVQQALDAPRRDVSAIDMDARIDERVDSILDRFMNRLPAIIRAVNSESAQPVESNTKTAAAEQASQREPAAPSVKKRTLNPANGEQPVTAQIALDCSNSVAVSVILEDPRRGRRVN